MKMAVMLSSLLLLTIAVIGTGCQQSREEQVEDAAEEAAENMEEAGEAASEAAEDAADEMEDRVDQMSKNAAERERHTLLAVNRYSSFARRIDELGFHLATIHRPGVGEVRTALDALRVRSASLSTDLAGLKDEHRPRPWAQSMKKVDLAFEEMSEEIEEIGNEMHELVCALHHHEGGEGRPTLLASAQ